MATQSDSDPAPATRRIAQPLRTNTHPLTARRAFLQRPPGAIFGDHYLYQRLVSKSDTQIQYQVDLLESDDELKIFACPNPECGAVFPPRSETPETFCTDCGTKLIRAGKDLVLNEFNTSIPEDIIRVASKGLSHGSVRAPLAAFVERLGNEARHISVTPNVDPFKKPEGAIKAHKALMWGFTLGRGLDYLHDNGVHFDGKIDSSCFGMVGTRIVWANFLNSVHHPDGFVTERSQDTKALAQLVFEWLSGKSHFEPVQALTPAVQQVFEAVFIHSTVSDGKELANRLKKALEDSVQPLAVDLQSGRRSDVGMVRNLNEDSLMTLELDRNQQSISHNFGLYVVADGMGGHAGGEVASGQIVELFSNQAIKDLMPVLIGKMDKDLSGWLKSTVEAANRQVFNLRKTAGTDMGSTLVAAAMIGNVAYVTHIGDSRAYIVNQDEIRRITVDHSLVERMIASHQITREEARRHPQRNVIYRTIGDKPDIEVEVQQHILETGDHLLLCSDGLSGPLNDESIHRIILNATSPQEACDDLVKAANAAGGDDNISVILVRISAS